MVIITYRYTTQTNYIKASHYYCVTNSRSVSAMGGQKRNAGKYNEKINSTG